MLRLSRLDLSDLDSHSFNRDGRQMSTPSCDCIDDCTASFLGCTAVHMLQHVSICAAFAHHEPLLMLQSFVVSQAPKQLRLDL